MDGTVFTFRRIPMAQTIITTAFERYKAQEAAGGRRIKLDTFIFANVPNISAGSTPGKNDAMPSQEQIVHRQAVDATGMVNENVVTYSTTLPESVGDFDFNWLGLINSESNTLCIITHMDLQKKIKTAAGHQGNVLTYSNNLGFSGASEQTGITTPVGTWQINFSARLHGLDEMNRLAALDIYGPAIFFDDAFRLQSSSAGAATLAPGIAYLRGLRVALEKQATVAFTLGSAQTISIDCALKGGLTGEAKTEFTLVNRDATDYVDALGFAHFVEPIANIDANGVITDRRRIRKPPSREQEQDFLSIKASLKEIADKGTQAQARSHLGLGDAATKNTGTTAGTLAAGDDERFGSALQKSKNGTDIDDKAAFRRNLGLGDAATKNTGATAGTLAAGDDARISGAMQKNSNGNDIPDKTLFVENVGLSETVNRASHINDNGDVNGTVWGGFLSDYLRRKFQGITTSAPQPASSEPKTVIVDNTQSLKNQALLATNGYFKDTSTGFIVQWGKLEHQSGGTTAVTLPIPFPQASLWVTAQPATVQRYYAQGDFVIASRIMSRAQIELTSFTGQPIMWIAIGH
ncbi:phage tail protein [Edwardsiella tarda]|uniref:phage tail-collar fiber domain-containing protein n=1 Tax=Edwardsiella tarda TaxID=636 RepID=UPI0024440B45|nr:phage tail protein [Edwardsiella tarda]WGE29410.1 phage tail protein [Edwardsiella tarda]